MKQLIAAGMLVSMMGLAQESAPIQNPIDAQFENLITSSNNFKEYKVVKETELKELKSKTASYITQLDQKIADLEASVDRESQAQEPLQEKLKIANASVEQLSKEKESISILGILMDKDIYSIIVWSIVGVLAIALISLFLQFKKSNAVTQHANAELAVAEAELEELRRKSIEEKQQLGRKLQDERNKLSRLQATH